MEEPFSINAHWPSLSDSCLPFPSSAHFDIQTSSPWSVSLSTATPRWSFLSTWTAEICKTFSRERRLENKEKTENYDDQLQGNLAVPFSPENFLSVHFKWERLNVRDHLKCLRAFLPKKTLVFESLMEKIIATGGNETYCTFGSRRRKDV